jgi:hypothetical protein
MKQATNINKSLLIKFMIIGTIIGLLLTMLFIRTAEAGNPVWPKGWVIRPLIILPLASAIGSAFAYYLIQLTAQGGWRRVLAIVLSLVIYLVGLWMGFILGFDGTLWN